MTERGFIAVARGMLDHPIIGVRPRTPYSRTEAWQWLLFEAAYRSRRYQAGSAVVELQRGQLAHSTRYMAKAWRWPETNVRRFLEHLKTGAGTGAMIGAESGAGITVITICNYERYQTPQDESGAESGAPDGAASGAKVAHDRRRKEQGNKETKENTRSRAGEPDGFAEWYAAYPRREDRRLAAKAYKAALARGDCSIESLLLAAQRYASEKSGTEAQFIKLPASWLNASSYLNEATGKRETGDGLKMEAPTQRDPQTFTESDWRDRIATFKSQGRWPETFWGPPPGSPGCLVPSHLIGGSA